MLCWRLEVHALYCRSGKWIPEWRPTWRGRQSGVGTRSFTKPGDKHSHIATEWSNVPVSLRLALTNTVTVR
jgi:hypothetical protein